MAIKLLLGSTPEDCKRGNNYRSYINNKIKKSEKSKIELCFYNGKCSNINHKDQTVYLIILY